MDYFAFGEDQGAIGIRKTISNGPEVSQGRAGGVVQVGIAFEGAGH